MNAVFNSFRNTFKRGKSTQKENTSKDEDDPYAGFGTEEVAAPLQTEDLAYDEGFQAAIRTSHGRRPPGTSSGRATTALRLGTGAPRGMTSFGGGTAMGGRPTTGMGDNLNRPMTGIRGAGYPGTAAAGGRGLFDPLNQATRGTGSPGFEARKEETPEDKIKGLEKKVNALIEESCFAAGRGEIKLALDRAKEASTKERSLIRLREQAGLTESHNLDLTFSVLFNLANQYANNEMYTEALNTYQVITKNRMFNNAGRLKVNMGNIYFKLGQYAKAIKFYRMALDQVPNTHKRMRIKIMHNIGILFVKMGQYSDACTSFEWIMSEQPDFKTGLHLILCYYSLADKERMKKGFQQLLEVPVENDDEDKYTSVSDDPLSNLILEVIKNDNLRRIERSKKHEMEHSILTAAKLISPMIEDSFSSGYNWCVDTIKMSSQHSQLANDLEINKAVMFLKQKDFTSAVETLKAFEKQDSKVASTASTNLSFLYFLQGDLEQAERYAEHARRTDSYNAAAFVNLGNCCYQKGDIEKAKEMFQVALDNDASCVEALYNLGLCHKQLKRYEESLEIFFKLQSIVRNHPEVMFQIANVYELVEDIDQAIEWYLQLLGLTPTDPVVLQKMGNIFDNEGDKQQAYQYNFDSYRYYPSNLEVIDWLGSYFIEMQVSEKAVGYFERAALMQPQEPKWQLMVASCYRRSGNYHRALETYKMIHRRFPANIECLKFLIKLCSDMGLKEASEYAMELKKAERAKEVREQRASSSRPGSRINSRTGSAASYSGSPQSSRQPSSRLSAGTKAGLKSNLFEEDEDEEPYRPKKVKDVDSSYSDPLGPAPERPRTSAGTRGGGGAGMAEDEFGDEDIGDDLLPE